MEQTISIELNNGEGLCREFVFESSYEPKLILQESILDLIVTLFVKSKLMHHLYFGNEVIVLTGFEDTLFK